MRGPKVLILDIETAPIIAQVWGLWDNNVALNQIQADWYVISWAAKWLGSDEVFQQDQRKTRDYSKDKNLLKGIWKLIDEADIIVTQNGKNFDQKKLNARFIINGMSKPSPVKHIDTCQIAKNKFGFTSNKLEYLSDKLCKRYKKLKHTQFPGHDLWMQCLQGNQKAWVEMAKYNIHDVLVLEELYGILEPWDTSVNFNVYRDAASSICNCGNTTFVADGFRYTANGKFQRYSCSKCRASYQDKTNLLGKAKRKNMLIRVS